MFLMRFTVKLPYRMYYRSTSAAMKKVIMGVILMLIATTSHATCWKLASHTYGIETRLLKAIAMVESNLDPTARNTNKNGTTDIGLMQINSMHLPRLKKLGVSKQLLQNDPCVSLMVGAYILNEMIGKYGYNWEAVGAYNAGLSSSRSSLRKKYADKVKKVYFSRKVEFD
ncbi:soluble lytic murein transglycosylase-like protein [Pantoea sp. SORGH_AS 659]|nr:soluble lytic murein transglycosylase-like protein [Pantoea sp. SORGH_AS_0659]